MNSPSSSPSSPLSDGRHVERLTLERLDLVARLADDQSPDPDPDIVVRTTWRADDDRGPSGGLPAELDLPLDAASIRGLLGVLGVFLPTLIGIPLASLAIGRVAEGHFRGEDLVVLTSTDHAHRPAVYGLDY